MRQADVEVTQVTDQPVQLMREALRPPCGRIAVILPLHELFALLSIFFEVGKGRLLTVSIRLRLFRRINRQEERRGATKDLVICHS